MSYALGYTTTEQDRLIRQAKQIEPILERLFREAGIGPGQRVLDLGSGVGDVSMLAARMVGPSGEVVGIERDASSIALAKARVAEAGFRNVSFTQADASQIVSDQPFDAAVGRFILMFLPDPAAVLQSLIKLVRPGGGVGVPGAVVASVSCFGVAAAAVVESCVFHSRDLQSGGSAPGDGAGSPPRFSGNWAARTKCVSGNTGWQRRCFRQGDSGGLGEFTSFGERTQCFVGLGR